MKVLPMSDLGRPASRVRAVMVIPIVAALAAVGPRAQSRTSDVRQNAFDEILDLNVRDGMVYYRALKAARSRLDGYLASLVAVSIDSAPLNEQIAFWINAYNAIVLQTVVEHYPIVQRTREYPAHSLRQVPGAFERLTHRLGGRTVTLDQIEQGILPVFHDPRVYLALGRGALGSGRLRSEAYTPEQIETQLTEVANECVNRSTCAQIDRAQDKLRVSSIFSWREKEFVAAYADQAPETFSARSPVERAALAFVSPKLLTTEREFLTRNEFKMEYIPFDWTLNDLTGRGGR
jgi:hypothetical protein